MESPERPIFGSRGDETSPFRDEGSEALKDELSETKSGEHHFSNLFDQDEDRAGEKTDLATGLPIDNSTDHGFEHLSIHEDIPKTHDEDEDDAAAHWLKENDPKYKK